MMLERQAIGIAKAKEDGKYKGRAPTARKLSQRIRELHLEGMKPSQIGRNSISVSHLFTDIE